MRKHLRPPTSIPYGHITQFTPYPPIIREVIGGSQATFTRSQ